MVAGNAMAFGPQEHTNWSCFDSGRQSSTIPTCPAGDHVSMNIDFPQCWNGALDSADHKSHVAYPSGGRCLASHPHAIPAISDHVLYAGGGNTSSWRLASDMYDRALPGGYSVHGDWFNAWKPDILQTWTRLCSSSRPAPAAHTCSATAASWRNGAPGVRRPPG
jgi:hypothetical protein